jgi:hypothetical protein
MILRQMTAQEVMALIDAHGAHEIPNDECYGAINALAREIRRLQKIEAAAVNLVKELDNGEKPRYYELKELLK